MKTRPACCHADDGSQDFGREARSAHAEKHDVCEAGASDAGCEGCQPLDRPCHELWRVEPPEAIGDFRLDFRRRAPAGRVPARERGCRALGLERRRTDLLVEGAKGEINGREWSH